jgi:hypothetical protein
MTNLKQDKIAVIHSRLDVEGLRQGHQGSIRKDYDVYIITMGKVDFNRFNESYKTNLTIGKLRLIEI